MMLQIPHVLSAGQVIRVRALIDGGAWEDGQVTAGVQSAGVKHNRQLPQAGDAAREAGVLVRDACRASPLFMSAALPHTVFPPLFNRYGAGDGFGDHVDNAMRFHPETGVRVRTDLSATLFLSDPESYDGGELTIEDSYGLHDVKLPAGDMILYPASSLHRVTPVTRGERIASFFWVQSLVREPDRRRLLFDMDLAIQRLAAGAGQNDPAIVSLTGAYHNLLRMWAEL